MKPLAVEDLLPVQPAEGHLLPPSAFTRASLFETEMARIFERSWVHVADLPDLQRAGDYVTGVLARLGYRARSRCHIA